MFASSSAIVTTNVISSAVPAIASVCECAPATQPMSPSVSSNDDEESPSSPGGGERSPPPTSGGGGGGGFTVPSVGSSTPNMPLPSPGINGAGRKSNFKRNKDGQMDKVLEQVNFDEKFSHLPEFNPADCQSPSALSLPSSPRVFVQNYRRKRVASTTEEEGDSDVSNASATPQSGAVVGHKFFGPDFSLDAFKADGGEGDALSPGTPKTPATGKDTSEKNFSSLRRILDQRRQLVMQLFQEHGFFPSTQATSLFQALHSEIFPTKSCLQLKIREVRQKVMAQSTTTSTTSSTSASTPAGINPPTGSNNTCGYATESTDTDMIDAHDANQVLDLATTTTTTTTT